MSGKSELILFDVASFQSDQLRFGKIGMSFSTKRTGKKMNAGDSNNTGPTIEERPTLSQTNFRNKESAFALIIIIILFL